ncbi:tRNA (guanosine(37)-N1)-methyltransferase TrmD [Candidatus Nomurabacteria bacterium]|nr:MAG: tRNA (guanosine(37)-N1)-methyltransferase TrmD [Candidatus Nomurabacteria bacterium]
MKFHIITIFPESFDSYLKESIIGRAIKNKKIKVDFYNPRKFVTGKYKKVWPDGNISAVVDDRPFGGGPGMIMRAEPILKAVEKILSKVKSEKSKVLIINFSPSGEMLTTKYIKDTVKKYTDVILICGRYEGIDARVSKILKAKQISIGDYVVTGGELPAMLFIDTLSRQIPGVLGKFESLEEERISSSEFYTRPEILEWKGKKHRVPRVLLSGDHKKIDEWKAKGKKL